MKTRILAGALVFLAGTIGIAHAVDLETRSLLDGKLSMLVPAHFKPMGQEMLRLKYPHERGPSVVLTDDDGTVNVALEHSPHAMTPADLPEAHQAFDDQFRSLHPSATWYRSEVTSINDRPFFVLELLTPAVDTEVHNIMAVTSFDGRMLLISVNLTKELEAEWLATAKRMVGSIRLRE